MTQSSVWRRPLVGRDPNEAHRASTPLELLYDLCFVVAVAQAAAQLHHGLAEGHVAAAVLGYVLVFFAIWWAWANFTWFASAYDTDDVPYRLFTLLQIAGVLVLAAGVPAAVNNYDFTTATWGYVIMRSSLLTQWARVAHSHPPARPAALRYVVGIGLCQIAWLIRLVLPSALLLITFILLTVVELLVPMWAEKGERITPWHPGHISERYGLFTLIVLGECVSAATIAVQSAITDHGLSLSLIVAAFGGLLLIFGLWWSYFKHSSADGLRVSLGGTIRWAYSHYLIFAAIAALGAGLEVVTDTLVHAEKATTMVAAFAVAIPVVIYSITGSFMHAKVERGRFLRPRWTVVYAICVVLAAFASPVITLPGMLVVMGFLLAMLVAANVVTAQRAEARTLR